MTETIVVRAATTADLAALAPHEPRPGLAESLLGRVGEDFVLATAWRGDDLLGWGALDLAEDDLTPELSHVWVLPAHRRQGVGKAVSSWLEAQARERGLREVFLLVDPAKESAAIPLYLDLDYTPTGDHRLGEVYATGEQTHQAIYRKSLTIKD